uniref:Pentatricopeptide repeat-containing protein n=1 Tax=Ananas comosus var. bracteatus TaxID=296719 RepID=A0A6V7PPA2_ANACO|nr:unnamed protein product [Ananas comosus var. bracteatus]
MTTRASCGSHYSLFRSLLRCAARSCVAEGRSLHARLIKIGSWADVFLANSVVNMYAKCGHLSQATAAFDEMRARDVVSWNCLINSYSRQGPRAAAAASVAELFRRMRAEGGACLLPNAFTFAGVFTAAPHSPDAHADFGFQAHCVAVKTADCDDVFLGSSLLNMYCKLGLVSDARKVFDRMPHKNSVSWAAMISGYAVGKCPAEGFWLFRLIMRERPCSTNEFVVTSVLSAVSLPGFLQMGRQIHALAVKNGLSSFLSVENSLVTLYAKCESPDDALLMFDSSRDKNSITWSAMITGYAQNGNSDKALLLFSQMQSEDIRPSEFTFVGVLNACSDAMALLEGRQAHCYLLKLGFELQVYVKSALVDMYAKCSNVVEARKGFDQLLEEDVVLWTTMIAGHVQNGQHEEALTLYGRMEKEGILPNNLTIVSVLRACSGLAALEQGKQMHAHALKRMPQRDVVDWNSIISGFSQNGRGSVALDIFEEMKRDGAEPDHITFINLLCACSHMGLVERGWFYFSQGLYRISSIDHGTCLWRIVLGACRSVRNFSIGAYAGERLIELGSKDSSAYILLSNIYAAERRWDDMERVRRIMRLRGVSKEPGCSWVELQNGVHVFVVGDQHHPYMEDINAQVRRLTKHMNDEGYHPASRYFCDDLELDIGFHNNEDIEFIASAVC